MPSNGFFNLLTDQSDDVYGAAPKIPLLKRPAAYRGYGLNNFSKRVDFKDEYINAPTSGRLNPTALSGGMKGSLDMTKPLNMTKMSKSGIQNTSGTAAPKSKIPYGAIGSGIMSGAGSVFSAYNTPDASAASKDAAAASGVANAAADTLMSIPTPWTMAIGAGIKATDMIGKPLLNSMMSKSLKDFGKNTSKELQQSSGFSGVGSQTADIGKEISSYKSAGLFGKMGYQGKGNIALELLSPGMGIAKTLFGGSGRLKALQRQAEKNLRMQGEATDILKKSQTAKEAALTGADDITQRTLQSKYSPDMYSNIRFGKLGMKIVKFQNGGKVNVIVNGKLHKELHGIENKIDIGDSEMTRKGVPVISMEDGGEILQHAEVEKNELILTKELTKKLEELESDGSEEAMIEAGRILSKEIVKNTKDSKDKIIKNA